MAGSSDAQRITGASKNSKLFPVTQADILLPMPPINVSSCKLLLPLLACGMFASAFAQPGISKKNNADVSEKWVITPVSNMKGVLGRLDINFPADVERDILIYQPADNKFITSVSRNDKIYTIAPGQYRFTLSNVPVDSVPIQKGHETRLKAGFLNVVSEGDWHVYSDRKKAIHFRQQAEKNTAAGWQLPVKGGIGFLPGCN